MKYPALGFLGEAALTPADGQNAGAGTHTAPPDDRPVSLESLLNTKVVTASRFTENLAGAPGVMNVVSRDEINRFGGLTLREILGRVAGLDLAANIFPDRRIVTVRGDQSKDTSVQANRAIWLPAWGYGSSSTLPLDRGRTIYYGVEFSFKRE